MAENYKLSLAIVAKKKVATMSWPRRAKRPRRNVKNSSRRPSEFANALVKCVTGCGHSLPPSVTSFSAMALSTPPFSVVVQTILAAPY